MGKRRFLFPSGITVTHALTPTLSLRERGLAVFRNQSLTAGGMNLQAGAGRSEARHPRHYRRLSTRLIPSMA